MLALLCEKIERDTRFDLDHIRDGWPVTERHNPPERLPQKRLLELVAEAERQNLRACNDIRSRIGADAAGYSGLRP